MKSKLVGWQKAAVLFLLVSSTVIPSHAHAQPGDLQIVDPKPVPGTFYSLQKIANGNNEPPLPWDPFPELDVYSSTTFQPNFLVYFYNDLEVDYGSGGGRYSTGTSEPPDPGGGGSGADPGIPPPPPVDVGTNLYILIGPTNNHEAWLRLTNTHYGVYYQLLRRAVANSGAWTLGQIVQDIAGTNQVRYDNTRSDYPPPQFFRGVGGVAVASVGLNPDYNVSVEPAVSGGSAQGGKFQVSIYPAQLSSLTVVYQVSGSAASGTDYTALSGSVSVDPGSHTADINLEPLYDRLAEFDEIVTVTLVLTNGYVVDPKAASATLRIYDPRPPGMAVAIHDSGWTRVQNTLPTNWNYFVLVESIKQALRSDGTPYVVVNDLDIANGVLMTNGVPKYPIFISLASETMRDDEIAPLTNYVSAGGFIMAGSSSFTSSTNGTQLSNFAFANEMGLSCNPSATNWVDNTYLQKVADHRLVNDLPPGPLLWRMPTSPAEISWGLCGDHAATNGGGGFYGPHQVWQVSTNAGVQVLATGDTTGRPYLAVKPYGNGQFIYDAALQPLIAHGGFGPGMYAYTIFRRAIEWAFESAQRPLAKLSPWPYAYDAAFMIRHDLENYANEIDDLKASARFEYTNNARGDYYFCTGTLREDAYLAGYNTNTMVANLRSAVTDYGATIGSHNGGLPNPRTNTCGLVQTNYEYWHWGPDEALDLVGGADYASNSVYRSFQDLDAWLSGAQTGPRLWVAPYFNATREESLNFQEQMGVKIAGDQKLSPFPSWTLSTTREDGPYHFLSEPVSDWFVRQNAYGYAQVAQSLETWHPPGVHTFESMHEAVDAYYRLGALINVYSHTLSDPNAAFVADAHALVPDYIIYSLNTNLHPRVWSSNAKDVYQWWVERTAVQITPTYSTSGATSITAIAISGPHTNTAVEVLVPGKASFHGLVVLTNGIYNTNVSDYRTNGGVVRVRAAGVVTNVEVRFVAEPTAQDDTYVLRSGQVSVGAPGILTNDASPRGTSLSASKTGGESGVTLDGDGGFSCSSCNATGQYSFTYTVNDGQADSATGRVTFVVTATNAWFDDFVRARTNVAPLLPWTNHIDADTRGDWTVQAGLVGASGWTEVTGQYGIAYYGGNWTNYEVETEIRFQPGAYGGGLAGRLNLDSTGPLHEGRRYTAWIYPEGSPDGSPTNGVLRLAKFTDWTHWGQLGSDVNIGNIGTNRHTLKLVFNGAQIQIYFGGAIIPQINLGDNNDPYLSGGVSLDMWTSPYRPANMSADRVVVSP